MSEVKILDSDTAKGEMGGDAEIYQEILTIFLEDTPKRIAEMQDAFVKKDLLIVFRSAHSMKSTSRTIGGMRLGDTAEKLEKCESGAELSEIEIIINKVSDEFELLKNALKKEGYDITSD